MADRASLAPHAASASPCVAVVATGAAFTLYPPTPFELAEESERYKLVLPFGRAAMDIAVGGAPCIRRQLKPGDLILVQPGSRLLLRYVEPVEFLLVLLDPEGVRQAAEAAAGANWRLQDMVPWHDTAAAALGQELRRVLIGEALPAGGYLVALASALIARAAAANASEGTRASRELIGRSVLARVARHVEAHLTGTIEVAELAQVAGLSPAHFARVFASATGETPHRFVMKRRVCRARDMLADGQASIAEVAVRTGFSSQAHLSTAFLKEVGTTPARYRAAFLAEVPANGTSGAVQA